MRVRSLFSDSDLADIRAATERAEELTGGELVCVIVGRCDDYPEAAWRGSALGALAAATVLALWRFLAPGWLVANPAIDVGIVLLGLVVGWALVRWIPPLARRLVDSDLLDLRAARRAAVAFIDEEVFNTADRTGILLFVGLFEHRVEILADEGIRSRVADDAWEAVIDGLKDRMHRRRYGEGVKDAVEQLGGILADHGVPRRPRDLDELSNEPRILDR